MGWVVKKGHAFAFWQEADASLSLEVFTGISVGGTSLQVELYDTNRMKLKEERRKEESREKNHDEMPKKSPRTRKRRTDSDKSPKSDVKESQNSSKFEDSKKQSKPIEGSREKPTTPKKTENSKAKESTEQKESLQRTNLLQSLPQQSRNLLERHQRLQPRTNPPKSMDQQGPKPQQSRPPLPPRPPHPLREARLETGSPEEKMPPRKIARSLRQWPVAWMYFDTLRLFNTTHCSHVEPLSMNCFYCRKK